MLRAVYGARDDSAGAGLPAPPGASALVTALTRAASGGLGGGGPPVRKKTELPSEHPSAKYPGAKEGRWVGRWCHYDRMYVVGARRAEAACLALKRLWQRPGGGMGALCWGCVRLGGRGGARVFCVPDKHGTTRVHVLMCPSPCALSHNTRTRTHTFSRRGSSILMLLNPYTYLHSHERVPSASGGSQAMRELGAPMNAGGSAVAASGDNGGGGPSGSSAADLESRGAGMVRTVSGVAPNITSVVTSTVAGKGT